ncbi:MAG: flagellar hook-basal body complex protein FliE [Burkholderiales bacterium]
MAAGKSSQGAAAGKEGPQGVDFGAVLKGAIDQVNATQQQAGTLARQFELGDPQAGLQDVMVSLQKANISFQTMVQVRNKLISAYHEIMNMQV